MLLCMSHSSRSALGVEVRNYANVSAVNPNRLQWKQQPLKTLSGSLRRNVQVCARGGVWSPPGEGPSSTHGQLPNRKERRLMPTKLVAAMTAAAILVAPGWNGDAVAGDLFGLGGGPAIEKDFQEPFTIYGTIERKYLIEQIRNGRIIGRKRGFTASVCCIAVEPSQETPEFQTLPVGYKMSAVGYPPSCSKGEGQSREDSCEPACLAACQASIAGHNAREVERLGYGLDEEGQARAQQSCMRQCSRECIKPGNYGFFISAVRPAS